MNGVDRGPRARLCRSRRGLYLWYAIGPWCFAAATAAAADTDRATVQSPDGRNQIVLEAVNEELRFTVRRDGREVVNPSRIDARLKRGRLGARDNRLEVTSGTIDNQFAFPWGKTSTVVDRCATAVAAMVTSTGVRWEIELRAYDDGVAFRYRIPRQPSVENVQLNGESTQFHIAGSPRVLFDTLEGFTTSHEALFDFQPLASVPVGRLMDCPLLLVWPDGQAAAISEARVRRFAGMYLERPSAEATTLQCRLAPLPDDASSSVKAQTPLDSPWRVVLLADSAGELHESNLLLCLNDAAQGDFSWLKPGKTTFHWWNGEFEEDFKLGNESDVFIARHRTYIDFCARNGIAYHGVSGDGRPWYLQSSPDYAVPSEDADVRKPRPELNLPSILDYARQQGVGIRLWVHWKPLSQHLDEAFALYEQWGVRGLMVDFLDRDDQEMIEFTERMLHCAARHRLHIQIHGSSKNSGEQRTFPHLLNREGVLNLEYVKWSDVCTPEHNVNVAFTRALAGPVDYHLGGFRSVPRAEFRPISLAPVVMGTRCHNLALYLVYENPMPMIADSPGSYDGQPGFEFLREVPTTWDETRFIAGQPGEYIVLARRKNDVWYLGGITNWTPRNVDLPLNILGPGTHRVTLYTDGSLDEAHPNDVRKVNLSATSSSPLRVSLAPGGGFVGVLKSE